MSVTIAGTTFEHHHYDQRGDVLYLSVAQYDGPPASAWSTPEGHNVEYDEAGRIVGMTLMNVRWLLDRDGQVTITLPTGHASPDDLAQALQPAASRAARSRSSHLLSAPPSGTRKRSYSLHTGHKHAGEHEVGDDDRHAGAAP